MAGDGTAAGPRLWPLGGGDPPELGPYRLLGRLGAGGMGRIYLGRVGPGAPLVAVKTLLAEGDVSAADRRRFTREVTLAQRIDSAHTAKVVDADPAAPSPWMAIQYIPAPSLAELVRRGGRLPASAIRWIAAGTAQALDALHRQGVVHRDVKPQNILLPMDGPRLIDFGISHAQDITRTTLTLGTIAFTSPEQARGEPSTAASDMYSLGATLFHLAVGRPPYPEGEDTLRLLLRVSRGELDLTGLPKELVPLVRPCLETLPQRRPRPEQVLQRFLAELTGLPASRSGRRWLPPRWTEVIEAYEQQGRAWERGLAADPDALTVDQRTSAVPPPEPTRAYTREQTPEGVRAPDREQTPERAQTPERERPQVPQREQARGREGARAPEREQAPERAQTPERERPQAPQRKQAREREQARSRPGPGPASASTSTPGTGSGSRTVPPVPKPPKKSSGGGCVLFLVALIVLAVLARSCDDPPWSGATSGTTSGKTGNSASAGSGTGAGTGRSTGGGSSAGGDAGGGTRTASATPRPRSSPVPRRPAPTARDLAFRAVRAGDCLDVHGDGYGRWSRDAPVRVRCDSARAYVSVTRAGRSSSVTCPRLGGRGRWADRGRDGVWTVLCVTRRFRAGQCFTAKLDENRRGSANLLVVWNCASGRVPKGQTHILRITGYYRKPSGRPVYCGDPATRYLTWDVNDGRSVLCTRIV
ncbi:hypothetical protein BJP40_11460 [Streptomyces sp. CC53]|uniref:serine/threonine protein kinase n=1 Tax=unclassified Streptomyces TaxID=2593676 RepID=UPI0008DDDEA2|nr:MULTISPECIES: serine/threonine-protein kinase [unclassified Streptomyces]OII60131.1 hypothetical protein BJP40_11460 [Streptomyces sp. CC53]